MNKLKEILFNMEKDTISMEEMRDALKKAAGIPQNAAMTAENRDELNRLYVSAKKAGVFTCQEGRIFINKEPIVIAKENLEGLTRTEKNVLWGIQKVFFGCSGNPIKNISIDDFIEILPMEETEILGALVNLGSMEIIGFQISSKGEKIVPGDKLFNMWTPAWDIAGGTFKVGSWKAINSSVVFSGYTEYKTYSEAWVSLVKEMRATPKKLKPKFGIVLNGQEDFGYDKYGPVSEINPVW